MTRIESIRAGLPRYTGSACPRHGEVERYTLSGNCCECARASAIIHNRAARDKYRAAKESK